MALTPYGPGKFNLNVDAFVHAVTLDGCCDEEGDVSENGVWYGKVEGPFTVSAADRTEHGLSDEDCAFLKAQAGAVVSENDQGFVTVDYFEHPSKLDRAWYKIVTELEQA